MQGTTQNVRFSVPYFGLACDDGNSFLCLEEQMKEKVLDRGQNVFLRAMTKNGSSRCFLAKNGCTLKTIAAESIVGRI